MVDYHLPVMLAESVAGLAIKPDGTYVDVTFGGGGHSREILKQLKNGRLFVFDQDEQTKSNLPQDNRLTFIHSNFRFLEQFARFYNFMNADGILADLGVSSHHFDTSARGFSFRFDDMLDMRMNTNAQVSALQVINEYSEEQLADLFFYYGEVRNARLLAAKIVKQRSVQPIKTTGQLKAVASTCTPDKSETKYLSQVFQAIRIEVNNEMLTLKQLLEQTPKVLASGGRVSVITYHSLEDRLVKNFLKTGNFEGIPTKDFYGNVEWCFEPVSKKVIIPQEDEIEKNTRARSAKLRIAQKK